jgi:hypothetical protein
LKAQASTSAASPPPIDLAATVPKPQQSRISPRRLVPLFIDADRISDVQEALRNLGIEAFSTADGYCENLNHSVPRIYEPQAGLQDTNLSGCSIDQHTYDRQSLTNLSSRFEELTLTLSRLCMSTNLHVDSYLARSAPALIPRSSPPASTPKKKYYVITVGKCVGIYYDEWCVCYFFFISMPPLVPLH